MRNAALLSMALALTCACRDVSRFSSKNGRYEGSVVAGSFVRAGVTEGTKMCLSLDTDHLQDAPGTLTTSDGRFVGATLRPIPQIWHDPLSTLDFGDGRIQNLVYAASPIAPDANAAETQDVLVVVSLMQSRHIEVRLLRGAPQADLGPPPPGVASPLFAVFQLEREHEHERESPCAF